MPKFAANLSMLFNEVPFLDRFAAASRGGFRAVEYVGPYDHPPELIGGLLDEHKLVQALFNMPAGNWAAGERGIGCHPDRVGEFQDGVETTVRYAKALGCNKVNCLSGLLPKGVSAAAAEDTFVGNLKFAADKLAAAGIHLVIEAINTNDMPGFFLNRSGQAMTILDRVGSTNLTFQYDIYHMQRMEGELAKTIERLMPRIGHFQIAGNPNRTEPDRGEINYPFLFDLIDRLGYDDWIGAEYRPAGRTEDGLGWLANW